MKVRTFIAVEIRNDLLTPITNIQENLKNLDADISWVKPNNIHITLKFLGDTKIKAIEKITQNLKLTLSDTDPFEIELGTLGAFPDVKHPKIIWAGLTESQNLVQIAEQIETCLGNIGIKKEKRPFHPHITLGRTRSFKNIEGLSKELEKVTFPDGLKQPVNAITFFKSTLTSSGPIYEAIQTIPLKT